MELEFAGVKGSFGGESSSGDRKEDSAGSIEGDSGEGG